MLVTSLKQEVLKQTDHENISKVAYAFDLIQEELGSSPTGESASELNWEDIYVISQMIFNDWNNCNDIQSKEEEGYIVPYAIRKWKECFYIK